MNTTDKRAKFISILNELAKLEENNCCMECGSISPRWASVSLGIFLCMVCAGLHRSLGVHISRVKSLTLDSWTEEQIQFMRKRGNKLAKLYFEANLPSGFLRPKDKNSLLDFIKRKYEAKKYVSEKVPYDKWIPPSMSSSNIETPTNSKIESSKPTISSESALLSDIFSNDAFSHPKSSVPAQPSVVVQAKTKPTAVEDDLFSIFVSASVNTQSKPSDQILDNLFSHPQCASSQIINSSLTQTNDLGHTVPMGSINHARIDQDNNDSLASIFGSSAITNSSHPIYGTDQNSSGDLFEAFNIGPSSKAFSSSQNPPVQNIKSHGFQFESNLQKPCTSSQISDLFNKSPLSHAVKNDSGADESAFTFFGDLNALDRCFR